MIVLKIVLIIFVYLASFIGGAAFSIKFLLPWFERRFLK
jgi:hypothetical protein